jgi:ubiquitin carboxyl-terminal hydrolase 4/11/15
MDFQEFKHLQPQGNFEMRMSWAKKADVKFEKLGAVQSGYKAGGYDSHQGTVSLEDCLEAFNNEELLIEENQVYCRKCKEHRDTYKKMDVYKLPNILIIQLKRFSKEGGGKSQYGGTRMMTSSKNSDTVEFPVEGLDMSKYIIDPTTGESSTFDLYAISNHMGSLYGGHYTAYGKNSLTNKWYSFNDSSVSGASISSLVGNSAYCLFYRRRHISSEQEDDTGVDVDAID